MSSGEANVVEMNVAVASKLAVSPVECIFGVGSNPRKTSQKSAVKTKKKRNDWATRDPGEEGLDASKKLAAR